MVGFTSHRNWKGLCCRQGIIIRPLLDVFLHLHVNYVKLAMVQKWVLYQMSDRSDSLWWFWCFLLMSICSKIKVTVWFISICKMKWVLKFSLFIPSESIWPTCGMSTGVDHNIAILHQVVKVSVTSIVAHHPSFRPAGQKNNLPRRALGRTTNFCCSLTRSLWLGSLERMEKEWSGTPQTGDPAPERLLASVTFNATVSFSDSRGCSWRVHLNTFKLSACFQAHGCTVKTY